MSKKHYVKIAAIVKDSFESFDTLDNHALKYAVQGIANMCADENPNFDRARFLAACGVGGR